MLSKRLLTLASLIESHSVVADVGSDHALLPCYLVKEGISKKAYAIDNKKGPLDNARMNIANHHLEDSVFTILQSGIIDLPQDVNTIVIAGMGFNMIRDILLNDLDIAQSMNQIVIQSNNQIIQLREFFKEYNFEIIEERFVNEAQVSYQLFSVRYSRNDFNNGSIYYSDYLLNQSDDQYLKFLKLRLNELIKIKMYNTDYEVEYTEIKKRLNDIEK